MEGKKSRLNNTDLVVDRISDLPDSILGHILSFLPTENAVATSVLSKRWKFAWVTIHSLDFYDFRERWEFAWATVHSPDFDDFKEEKIMEFVRFVNRVLLLNDAGLLSKFGLNCCPHSFSPQIISWINTAITRNVHELDLNVGDIDLPTSLFSCDSLRSLVLYGSVFIYDSTTVCLPRLENLKIDRVFFESKEACEKLINGCPILHYLNLDIDGDADDDFTCIISSASLRRLEIYFVDTSYKLKLKASSLEYLRLYGSISEIFVEKSLSYLVEADFNIDLVEHDFPNNSIVEAVRAFDCSKFLTLSADVMRALSRATISLSTEFKRLVELVAETYCCSIQDFIQNSENLEDLIIYQDSFWPGIGDLHDHPRWTTPVEVPRCLSNSLKKVRLHGYKGLEDEREMIRYMLEHGSALEVMQIYCNSMGDGEKLKLIQEIREFPRKSPVCKV